MPDLKRSAARGNNDVASCGPSQALLAAQRRLEQLRAERQWPRRASVEIFRPQALDHQPAPAGHPFRDRHPPQPVPPTHDAPGTNDTNVNYERIKDENVTGYRRSDSSLTGAKVPPTTVRLQPALALAILGAEQAPAGRIWLLLRLLDEAGQGWLPADHVREQLTRKKSSSRKESKTAVCGRRQLRNLLNQGQGIFWETQQAQDRSRDRIWLKSPARVAVALGLERLAGRPEEIPLASLLGGIGRVRAHFYATFHSGRQTGADPGAPISRARLADLTHVPPRTQRLYDETAGIKRQANYAIGPDYNKENIQERAWQHGRAVFKFIDHQGKQGHAGRRYVAWRLPNSYAIADGFIADNAAPSGKRKRNNKRPVDLVTIGAQGNDRSLIRCPRQATTLFHPDGGAAGKAYNGDCSVDAYWPEPGQASRAGRPVKIWQVIGRSPSRRGGNCLPGL